MLKVDDYYYYSVAKVLFVLKIHCHLVQMTLVLSVKEMPLSVRTRTLPVASSQEAVRGLWGCSPCATHAMPALVPVPPNFTTCLSVVC